MAAESKYLNFNNTNDDLDQDMGKLGLTLKSAMAARSISMRKLSQITGICTASISRIINNKQAANIEHLQAFSKHLNIPMEQLLMAMGIIKKEPVSKHINFMVTMIQDILDSENIVLNDVIKDIVQELKKYERYARTEEANKLIRNDFLTKVNEVNGVGIVIEQLNKLYQLYCSQDIDSDDQAIIGSALLYFILSADIIPDYVFPIGYLDDAIAVSMVTQRLPGYF